MQLTNRRLYELLAEIQYLPAADLKRAVNNAAAKHVSLFDYLIENNILSDTDIGRLVADSLSLPFVSLGELNIDDSVLRLTPQRIALKYHVITYGLDRNRLQIASSDPNQDDVFAMLAKKAGANEYRVYYATDKDLETALLRYKQRLQEVSTQLVKPQQATKGPIPITRIVDTLVEYAYDAKASDIHIEPTRSVTKIRYRIDGILHDVMELPHGYHSQLVARIKVLSRLRTDEHLSAQDGRLHVDVREETVDIRVSIVPIVTGEKVVLRLLTSHSRQYNLSTLGMRDEDLAKTKRGYSRPYGMVLSTGPTGSGKTTSMYAILKLLNTRDKNIATIEDPVEYEIEGINQIQTNDRTNLTFANGLRSILRQDPNIIYVGEIRDEETARIAVNSATTGHLVLSTLHTNDAATALPRLIDMQVEPFLVASTINTIVAQRLIRKICERCKFSLEMTRKNGKWTGDIKIAAELDSVDQTALAKYLGKGATIRVYQGKGCTACRDTGYSGRIGIFEILEVSPAIQKLIVAKASSDAINEQAVADGMVPMLADGLLKAKAGITTIEEIVRATRA